MHAYMYIHTCIHVHTYIHVYIHTYIHAYIHTYIHIYIHAYLHPRVSVCRAMICASEWVTAAFTIERYIAVCHPIKAQLYCTTRRAKWVSALILLLSVLINLEKPLRKHPHYIYHPVTKKLMDVQLLYTDIGVIPKVGSVCVQNVDVTSLRHLRHILLTSCVVNVAVFVL